MTGACLLWYKSGMFKPLGLFDTAQCPDKACRRPYCLFRHGESSRTGASSARQPAGVAAQSKAPPVRKRAVEGEGSTESGSKRLKNEGDPTGSPAVGGNGTVTSARRSETPKTPVLEQSKPSPGPPAVQKVSLLITPVRGKPLTAVAGVNREAHDDSRWRCSSRPNDQQAASSAIRRQTERQ